MHQTNYDARDQYAPNDRIPSATFTYGRAQGKPSPHEAKHDAAKPVNKRSRCRIMCSSICSIPWFTLLMAVTVLSTSITWQKFFLRAAVETGKLLQLAQVQEDSLLNRLWKPHKTLATGCMVPCIIIALLVIVATAMQLAVRGRANTKGRSAWATINLGLSGMLVILLWLMMLLMTVLLAASVVWMLSTVVVKTAARDALSQLSDELLNKAINLQAPDAAAKIYKSYSNNLRPLLTQQDQTLADTFLNRTLTSLTVVSSLTGCRSTCLDLTRFQDSLGTTACICDTDTVKVILQHSNAANTAITSSVLCLVILLVVASLLMVNMAGRFVLSRYLMSGKAMAALTPQPTPGTRPDYSVPSDTEVGNQKQKMLVWQGMHQQQAPVNAFATRASPPMSPPLAQTPPRTHRGITPDTSRPFNYQRADYTQAQGPPPGPPSPFNSAPPPSNPAFTSPARPIFNTSPGNPGFHPYPSPPNTAFSSAPPAHQGPIFTTSPPRRDNTRVVAPPGRGSRDRNPARVVSPGRDTHAVRDSDRAWGREPVGLKGAGSPSNSYSRDIPLRDSQQSDGTRTSSVAWDEPNPEVILDRRRKHFDSNQQADRGRGGQPSIPAWKLQL